MGASIATLLQSFQKSAATPDGFLFQTVKNLKGGKYKTTRNYEAAKVKGILMTMGDGSLGETVDPDGLEARQSRPPASGRRSGTALQLKCTAAVCQARFVRDST